MSATFFHAAQYWVKGVCQSPLRTGAADGDLESVLTDAQGVPILPGSSLAGALRGWLAQSQWSAFVQALFGSQERPGRLMVSDARFSAEAPCSMRPRLRIDGATGSAAPGGKFDVAQIDAGATFSFQLTWMGLERGEEELAAVEAMLCALDSGLIRLGAQKSNGFGRVGLQVRRRLFDMRDAGARRAWLRAEEGGEPLALAALSAKDTVVFTLSGRADSLLVKAAAADYGKQQRRSWTPNLSQGGKAVLPGSSIKGAVRARAQMIVRSAGLSQEHLVQDLFGSGAAGEGLGIAGSVRFEDCLFAAPRTQKISRIRIDRFTGGVIRGGLLTEEPLCGEVVLRLTAPDQPLGCALLLYALRDLGLGLYNLGSGGSIGRGYLHVERIEARHTDGRRGSLRFGEARCAVEDPDGLFSDWMRAWKEKVR